MIDKEYISTDFQKLQDSICCDLEKSDGQSVFKQDLWNRPGGGGGRSRIITDGNVIEKGGVNFSAVSGTLPDAIMKALGLDQSEFFATGVSIVIHPKSPFQPIIHMNIRYFELSDGTCWFGGGIDLTPIYIVAEQARFFHNKLKHVCESHETGSYEFYKKWADDYFFIDHRAETRGIGGIFFDKLSPSIGKSKEKIFEFVLNVGRTFSPTYLYLLEQNKDTIFGQQEKKWQALRRGRYVEFNLVYDKGTKFGLQTQGRTESILMSMPPIACWEYDFKVLDGSAEAQTQSLLRKGIKWDD